MDIFMQFIGSAGYPTSFVAAAVFFIFWHQKMLKSVQETKDGELQRLHEDNRTLRAENDEKEDEISKLKEKVWRAEIQLEMLKGNFPMKGNENGNGQNNQS